ncbi:MAG: hypothetical protein IJS08_15755 [Victivallales bacterium]|nr:hypothetical protein [Victivallales bacterium]
MTDEEQKRFIAEIVKQISPGADLRQASEEERQRGLRLHEQTKVVADVFYALASEWKVYSVGDSRRSMVYAHLARIATAFGDMVKETQMSLVEGVRLLNRYDLNGITKVFDETVNG